MEIITNPVTAAWPDLCRRNTPHDGNIAQTVGAIIAQVRTAGDQALIDYARQFDKVDLQSLTLPAATITAATTQIPPRVMQAMQTAAGNIRKFHAAQLPKEIMVETMPGVKCMQRPVAINRVGIYIPGGRAPLFSTVLMLAIPAAIAGCREIALFTPAGPEGISPYILAAAALCGITEVHPVGGAQAIAAMAYGTQSIRPVQKIFGPGNRYVTKAKQMVSNAVAIDMPAGPSEVMVLCDNTASPAYAAADMLSQAEHGPDSQAILVCRSKEFAIQAQQEILRQKALLKRQDSVEGSLASSRIIILPSRNEMLEFANCYAPEHLIISLSDPWQAAKAITAAGSIFIGNHSPESAGDYASGTNHTLPTSGWASALSGVNIDSYMHKITIQELTPQGLGTLAPTITAMAAAEGLDAHAAAVKIRLDK